MAVRIISTWLLRLLKLLALRLWVPRQSPAVSTGSNLTGKCVIMTIVGWGGGAGHGGSRDIWWR